MTDEERRVYKQKVSSEKNMINKGYQRVLEKIKDYWNTVIETTRPDSGKLVCGSYKISKLM